MANYTQLLKIISDNIKANGNQEITGQLLGGILQVMVTELGEGSQFVGIATPDANPGTPDGNVFYIAVAPGTYSNFGVIVPNGSIGIIHNTSSDWEIKLINTYYEIDVDTLMQDSPSSEDINEAIGSFTYLKRAITVGVPIVGKGASGGNSTVAIVQVKQLTDNEVRVVMLNTGTVDGSNELVPIIKKITNSAGRLSLSTEAPTSFIGPLSSLKTNEKGSVVEAINEVDTGLKSVIKPYVVDLTSLLAAQDSESISTAIGGIDNLNGTVQKNQVIFGTLANGTVAVGIRVLGNQTTLTYFVDSVVGLTVNEVIITNTSGTLTKTANTHAVLTENMVINSLDSDETTLPLSGAQGKVLATDKQGKTDKSLQTTDKTVAGAINEVNQAVKTKQDKLKPGTGVEITSDNTVNVTLDTTVFKVVASLPESPAAGDENKIHLVPAESTEEGNIYTEYVFVNGKWEKFGTYRSEVDLTPYLKKVDAEATYQKITDNTLVTTAKTIVGAINEVKSSADTSTGDVTRIDRAVGKPVIEDIDLTTDLENGYYWNTSGVKAANADYSIKYVNLSKGDLLIANVISSSVVAQLTVVDSTHTKAVQAIDSKGISSNYAKSSFLADRDCIVAISCYGTTEAGEVYAYIVKSPFNTAISDNSYMQYLHKVYEEYGAVYNAETGYWELNGLTDLTEEEMYDIYLWTHNIINQLNLDNAFSYAPIRTTFSFPFKTLYRDGNSTSLNQAFLGCSQLEIVCLNPVSDSQIRIDRIGGTACHNAFNACTKLREIKNILYVSGNKQNIFSAAFNLCTQLSKVRIRGLMHNVNFEHSPLLSYKSLNYIVTSAANTSAITITVHPTTYTYLMGTAEPTAEVGGTTEEWQALVTTAQGKQISFAVPEETQSEVTE